MREVKAIVRCEKVGGIIEALEQEGIQAFVVDNIMGVGSHLIDPKNVDYSMECVEQYTKMAKLEFICRENRLEKYLHLIRHHAYSGGSGDGYVYITPVETMMQIRSGESGRAALRQLREVLETE
ncbi:MAG TPA: P-II family nitrogen regulator [bacterium]|nr:P-II family nitrogen regulator [bacterium]